MAQTRRRSRVPPAVTRLRRTAIYRSTMRESDVPERSMGRSLQRNRPSAGRSGLAPPASWRARSGSPKFCPNCPINRPNASCGVASRTASCGPMARSGSPRSGGAGRAKATRCAIILGLRTKGANASESSAAATARICVRATSRGMCTASSGEHLRLSSAPTSSVYLKLHVTTHSCFCAGEAWAMYGARPTCTAR